MKRIDELNKEEILALSDQDVQNLIDLECAYKGIPLLPPCPVRPEALAEEKDQAAYQVAGYYFLTPDEAGRVLEALQSVNTYIKDGWSEEAQLRPVKPGDYNYPKVEAAQFYSKEKLSNIKAELTRQKKAQTAYEEAKKEYDRIFSERKLVAQRVQTIIGGVKENLAKRAFLKGEFDRYLKLANNNQEVTMNFLLKAYQEISTDFPDLVEKFCPGYPSLTVKG